MVPKKEATNISQGMNPPLSGKQPNPNTQSLAEVTSTIIEGNTGNNGGNLNYL